MAREKLTESKASVRLGKKVEAMISQIDGTLWQLEKDYIAGDTNGLVNVQEDK